MPPALPGKKRKQRSPFYTKVSKDGTKQKQGRSKYWCLSIWTRTGTKSDRTREFYSTLKEAKEAQENAIRLNRTEGLAAVEISTQLRIEAIRAADILKGRASLTEAAQYFMKHAAPSNEVTVRQLYKKYHDFQEAEGASASYMADIKWRMKRFAESFPKSKMAHEVKYSEITAYLSKAFVRKGKAGDKRIKAQVPRKLSPAGRRIELKNIRPMFNFALDEGHIQVSPFPTKSFRQRKSKDRQHLLNIRVLTLAEVNTVLANAGDLLDYFAFGLFCGVRPDETKALDWSDVTWTTKTVRVNARNSTSHDLRHPTMSENLLAWLKPNKDKKKGAIVSMRGFRERFTKVAKASGLFPWPSDVLRHTFASYWLAKYKDEATLKFLMGHHLSSGVLKKHYINQVTPEDADKFWAIFPD